MTSRHDVFVSNTILHFLYDLDISLWLKLVAIPSREQTCENIFCKDLTKKMQFENSILGLELKIYLNMPYR